MPSSIVIVEDEPAIAQTLIFALQSEYFSVEHFTLAGAALEFLRQQSTDLVIMDVGLPDIVGFEAVKQLRQFSQVPVIFLTARADEIDRILGLEIGGDDYVVKPFSPREVAARVKAILKRTASHSITVAEPKINNSLSMNAHTLEAKYCGENLLLTPAEWRILFCLSSAPGQVFSREALLQSLGQNCQLYERNIDTHVKTLRAKLRELQPQDNLIKTHRGFGYSLTFEK